MTSKTPPDLYATTPAIGLLKGFSPLPHQLEVDVVVPHDERGLPGFGEFLLVELSATEALVGRVSRYHAAGQLATERGDAYLADLAKAEDNVPAALMRQMLRYNLKMQLLGHLQVEPRGGKFRFSVGERAFATLGSKVRIPSEAALAFLCNLGLEDDPTAVPLGHLVYGQREVPNVAIRLSVGRLKGRRSFVFARAGYGKSNLIKYLVSQLYSSPPDVGLLIFDPEGEYALPDVHGRPGLVNVPALRDRISLYTNRKVDASHAGVVKGEAYVDFGDFPPQDLVAAFIPVEKQDRVFANLLRTLDWQKWKQLVHLLAATGFASDDKKLGVRIAINSREHAQATAILVDPVNGALRAQPARGDMQRGESNLRGSASLGWNRATYSAAPFTGSGCENRKESRSRSSTGVWMRPSGMGERSCTSRETMSAFCTVRRTAEGSSTSTWAPVSLVMRPASSSPFFSFRRVQRKTGEMVLFGVMMDSTK